MRYAIAWVQEWFKNNNRGAMVSATGTNYEDFKGQYSPFELKP